MKSDLFGVLLGGLTIGLVIGFFAGATYVAEAGREAAIKSGAACYQHDPAQSRGRFDWNCDGVEP